jgi:hypothetical protein
VDEIRARKRCSEGGMDGQRRGLPWGAQSEDGGGKKGAKARRVVRLLFVTGQVRQGGGGGRATWPTRGGSGKQVGGVPAGRTEGEG